MREPHNISELFSSRTVFFHAVLAAWQYALNLNFRVRLLHHILAQVFFFFFRTKKKERKKERKKAMRFKANIIDEPIIKQNQIKPSLSVKTVLL